LKKGGILVIDDIHIPSIQNLLQVVSHDEMFKRTDAPLFDPRADGWWLQGFNKQTLWRYSWQEKLKS